MEKAIEHEIARQGRLLDRGGRVVQETRLWDADAGLSESMRSKEEAKDYRYFPDPDLPPLTVDPAWVERVRGELPALPAARRAGLTALGLSADDARQLTCDRVTADFFDAALRAHGGGDGAAKPIANWLVGQPDLVGSPVAPADLAALVALIDDGTISSKIAKEVMAEMLAGGGAPRAIVDKKGLVQVTDTGAIEAMVAEVVAAHPDQAAAYRGGKAQLIGFFVGKVMKQSGGKANPTLVNQALRKILDGGG